MSNNTEQGVPSVTTTKAAKKKGGAGSKIFTTIIVLAALAFGGYYLATNFLFTSSHSISIENNKITTRNSGQDLLDKGLVLCDVNGKVRNVMTTEVNGKEIYNTAFFIGVPTDSSNTTAKCSGVQVTFGNFGATKSTIAKCGIYKLEYTPDFQDDGVSVLIDDENMKTASTEQWISFLEQKSYRFSKNDFEGLKSGKTTYATCKSASLKYSVELKKESKNDGNDNIVYEVNFKSFSIARDVAVSFKAK
ncbi:MAG: hypothetical protein IKM88_12625 [Lachnospiraceae bacterium]|nr:hypothetical protein [Clostridiales bacterium]MBR6851076.1 hypothetical protein [Lachnospiraceae bacterium]